MGCLGCTCSGVARLFEIISRCHTFNMKTDFSIFNSRTRCCNCQFISRNVLWRYQQNPRQTMSTMAMPVLRKQNSDGSDKLELLRSEECSAYFELQKKKFQKKKFIDTLDTDGCTTPASHFKYCNTLIMESMRKNEKMRYQALIGRKPLRVARSAAFCKMLILVINHYTPCVPLRVMHEVVVHAKSSSYKTTT